MGLFERFRRQQSDEWRSSILPALTDEQSGALHRLSGAVLADLGQQAVPSGDGGMRLPDGEVLGLHNLSLQVAELPPEQWDAVVRDHFTRLMALDRGSPTTLAEPSQIYLKLRHRDDLVDTPVAYPAREVLPDVLALVTVDYPTHTFELTESLDAVGGDLEAASQHAMRNLAALPEPGVNLVLPIDQDATSLVTMLSSDDFFAASRLLVLDDLLARLPLPGPGQVGEHGALVIVPSRHLMGVHLITGRGTMAAVDVLISTATTAYGELPGPISPHVFHLSQDGQATQASFTGADGTPEFYVKGPVEQAFRAWGLLQ